MLVWFQRKKKLVIKNPIPNPRAHANPLPVRIWKLSNQNNTDMSDKSDWLWCALKCKGLKTHILDSSSRGSRQRHCLSSVCSVEPVLLCYTGIWKLPDYPRKEDEEQVGLLQTRVLHDPALPFLSLYKTAWKISLKVLREAKRKLPRQQGIKRNMRRRKS